MRKLNVMLPFTLLLAAAFNLVGCSPTPTPAPTQDPAVVFTQVAATLYTRLTQSVTPTLTASPTQPPTATRTPEPTQTSALQANRGPAPTATLGTPLPTPTRQIVGSAARYLYTYPEDGFEVEPNHNFNIEWGLQNIGTIPWNTGYKLVWVGKEHFTNQTEIPLDRDVKPGEKGIFVLGVFGSEEWVTHRTDWQLVTDSGQPVPGSYVYFTYHPR